MESIIFMIVAGLIGMIFNRFQNGDSKEKRKSVPRNKPSIPLEGELSPKKVETPSNRRMGQRKSIKKATENAPDKFSEKKLEAKRRMEELKKKEGSYQREINENLVRVKKVQKGYLNAISLEELTREDLVKGVIMSEVLGPPRAKKRHHRK